MIYRVNLICPKCNKESEITVDNRDNIRVDCGDCLIERVDIVEMKVVRVVEEPDPPNYRVDRRSMDPNEAVDVLIAAACSYAENKEEQFPRRLKASDTDADLLALVGGDDDLDDAKEVRDIWAAVGVLRP